MQEKLEKVISWVNEGRKKFFLQKWNSLKIFLDPIYISYGDLWWNSWQICYFLTFKTGMIKWSQIWIQCWSFWRLYVKKASLWILLVSPLATLMTNDTLHWTTFFQNPMRQYRRKNIFECLLMRIYLVLSKVLWLQMDGISTKCFFSKISLGRMTLEFKSNKDIITNFE